MWVLMIGLAWLAVTALPCVLIGRAIRAADARDEELAALARAKLPLTPQNSTRGLSSRRTIMPPFDDGDQRRRDER